MAAASATPCPSSPATTPTRRTGTRLPLPGVREPAPPELVELDYAAPLKGLVAGLTGTVAMTLALRRVFPRVLPPPAPDRRGFLPEAVVTGLEKKLLGKKRMREHTRRQATMPTHYAFGAGAGLGYGLLRALADRANPALLGAAWGVAVWAASYEGWLPATGITPATTDREPRRWINPIAAHLVFGVATAYAFEALSAEPEGDRT